MSKESAVFKPWGKIGREDALFVTLTEKMNGTSVCVIVGSDSEVLGSQSRNRLLTVDKDHYGFAKWVEENKGCLSGLGPGHHFGEWAGLGIEKNPHNLLKKEFFLFDTRTWDDASKPDCCSVVPVLYEGLLSKGIINAELDRLKEASVINPEVTHEGVIAYYHNFQQYKKYTIKEPKYLQERKREGRKG